MKKILIVVGVIAAMALTKITYCESSFWAPKAIDSGAVAQAVINSVNMKIKNKSDCFLQSMDELGGNINRYYPTSATPVIKF